MQVKWTQSLFSLIVLCCLGVSVHAQDDGSVLPFPPTPMDSVANPRLQDSTMKWPADPQRLPADCAKYPDRPDRRCWLWCC